MSQHEYINVGRATNFGETVTKEAFGGCLWIPGIKALRRLHLSYDSGLPYRYLKGIERGSFNPTEEAAESLVKALGLTGEGETQFMLQAGYRRIDN